MRKEQKRLVIIRATASTFDIVDNLLVSVHMFRDQ